VFSFVKFSYNITINSDNTGSESAIFSFDGESDTENESFTWENKGLDFKATSQTYNFKYSGEESGEDEVATFSNDFKTLNLGGDNDGLNPFKKQ
tara:strand:- start:358 stop:639 length:282 start_codon:yes stop_codon:yes gene_type:complete